jgi:tetratricopeptide (TPR) repeat protein
MQGSSAAFGKDEPKLAKLQTILNLPRPVIERLLQIAGQQEVAGEKLAENLTDMAEAHQILIGEWLTAPAGTPPALEAFMKEARLAAEAGEYENAQAVLTKATVAAEAEAQRTPGDAANGLAIAASARAGLGRIALIRSEYRVATLYFAAAARLLADSEAERRVRYAEAEARALYLQGLERDDTGALGEAAERYRALLNGGAAARSTQIRRDLGRTLLRLGTRLGETALLQEALSLFRGMLEDVKRSQRPMEWARTQQDLGATLFRLGLAEKSTALLEESVKAFRDSLTELTRNRAPLEWAALQGSLGTALWSLGARETGPARFEEAVAAFREGLKRISRDFTPLDWATRQNNLGAALVSLAERRSSAKSLQDAIAAFRLSLETYQDESATYYIDGVKDNLDRAERMLKEYRTTGKMPAAH